MPQNAPSMYKKTRAAQLETKKRIKKRRGTPRESYRCGKTEVNGVRQVDAFSSRLVKHMLNPCRDDKITERILLRENAKTISTATKHQ